MNALLRITSPLFLVLFLPYASPAQAGPTPEGLMPVGKALTLIHQYNDQVTTQGRRWKKLYDNLSDHCKQTLVRAVQQRGGGTEAVGAVRGSLWAGSVCASADDGYSGLYGGPGDVLASTLSGLKGYDFVRAADVDRLNQKMGEWKTKDQELNALMVRLVGHLADHAICYENHDAADPECAASSRAIDADQALLDKFAKYVFMDPIRGRLAPSQYQIETVAVADHDLDSRKATGNSKVASAEAAVDRAKAQYEQVRAACDEANKVLWKKRNAENDLTKQLFDALRRLRDARTDFETNTRIYGLTSKEKVDRAQAEVEQLQQKLQEIHLDMRAPLAAAQEKALALTDADQKVIAAKAALTRASEERRELELQPVLEEVRATADGKEVFLARFSGERLAQIRRLQQLQDLKTVMASDFESYRQQRDGAEASLLALQKETQAQLDGAVSALNNRAQAQAVLTAFDVTTSAAKGFVEGGPAGSFAELAKFVEEQAIESVLADEKDLAKEVEEAIDKENGASLSESPAHRLAVERWEAKAGSAATEWGIELYSKVVEAFVTETLEPALRDFFSDAGLSTLSPALQQKITEMHEMDAAIAKLRSAPSVLKPSQSWREWAKETGKDFIKEGATKLALEAATTYSEKSIEDFFKDDEATAWANYFMSDRAERLQRIVFIEVSTAYRAKKKIYEAFLAAEEKLIEQMNASGDLKTVKSVSFNEGAKIVVTARPGLENFTRLTGDIGDVQLTPRSSGQVVAEAKGLGYRSGTNPKQIKLTLTVGGRQN
jgi:hypothetical protein